MPNFHAGIVLLVVCVRGTADETVRASVEHCRLGINRLRGIITAEHKLKQKQINNQMSKTEPMGFGNKIEGLEAFRTS